METNSGKNEGMDMSISIKDMLMRVCLKWRAMIVWAIVFAILFNGIGILKDYKAVQAQKQLEAEEDNVELQLDNAQKEVEKAEKELSDREISDVKRVVESYEDLQSRYVVAREYFENSARMQLDPSNVPTMTIQYRIDTKYQVEYPIIEKKDYTDAIVGAYCSAVKTDITYNEMKKNMNSEIEIPYIKELVDATGDSGNLYITIMAPTEEDCIAMGDVVKNAVSDTTSKLQSAYGEFNVQLIVDNCGSMANSILLNDQTTVVNNMNNIRSAIVNITSGMNDGQKSYYNALLDYDSIANPKEVLNNNEQETGAKKTSADVQVSFVHAKMIVVGAVAGIFLIACWFALGYIVSNRIRTADDIEEVYGMRHLGTVEINTKKKTIDKKIQEIFYGKNDFTYEEQMKMVCAGIRITAQKMGVKSLYITGSSKERLDNYYEEICAGLKNDIANVESGVSIIYDPESLENMSKSEAVVLVEKLNSSLYKEIKKEMDICLNNKIEIIGVVTLQ